MVKDSDGQKSAYLYFEEELGRRSAAKLLTRDEARREVVSFSQSRTTFRTRLPNPIGDVLGRHDCVERNKDGNGKFLTTNPDRHGVGQLADFPKQLGQHLLRVVHC